MLSTSYQTNEKNADMFSEDVLEFSRIERLHLLLDAHVVNDEEDRLLSSILHNRGKNIFCGSTSVQVLFPVGTVLGEEPAGSLLCGFALALPCKSLVATSDAGPIFVFPWIHPFGCDASSSLGRVYSRQATA